MTPPLSKGLSQLSVKLAIPALLFGSVVPGMSMEVLGYGWLLLILPAVYLLLGSLIGLLMLVLVRPPRNFRLGTVAACAFGNTTGIPIVLLSVLQQSLSRSVFADIADPLLFLSLFLLTMPILQVRPHAHAPCSRAPRSLPRPTRHCPPLSVAHSGCLGWRCWRCCRQIRVGAPTTRSRWEAPKGTALVGAAATARSAASASAAAAAGSPTRNARQRTCSGRQPCYPNRSFGPFKGTGLARSRPRISR